MLRLFEKAAKEYHADGKLYVCFVDLEKAFDRVPEESVGMNNEEERTTRSFG